MTIRTALRAAIIQALRGQTIAEDRVFASRDWPTEADDLPLIHVLALRERKERVRSGALFYTTTASIDVLAQLARGGPETAIEMMDQLVSDIMGIVICAPAVRAITQLAPNVEMSISLSSEGDRHVAQGLVTFSIEYPEKYQPGPGTPLRNIQANQGGFGSFSVDLPQ